MSRWVRAVRGAHTEWLRRQAIERLAVLDRDVIATVHPAGSPLTDALNVAAAALSVRARLAPQALVWALIVAVTRWRLLPQGQLEHHPRGPRTPTIRRHCDSQARAR